MTTPPAVLWKVDLHAHTLYSRDCLTRPEALIERARAVGLDRIAITEHNSLAGARRAKELAPELVILGEEIKTTHGELIAYFLQEEVPKGLSPAETIRRLREQGAFISIPHPLDNYRSSAMGLVNVMAVLDQVDALEVRNARCVRRADNTAAAELARTRGKLITAGSDAHTLYEVGRCHLEMPAFSDDPASFRASLGKATAVGMESPFWPHLISSYAKIRKRVRPVTYQGLRHSA